MDLVEDSDSEEEVPLPPSAARRASVLSSRLRRYSTVRMDHLGGTTMVTTVMPVSPNHLSRVPTIHRHHGPGGSGHRDHHQGHQGNHVQLHRQGSQRQSHRSPHSG